MFHVLHILYIFWMVLMMAWQWKPTISMIFTLYVGVCMDVSWEVLWCIYHIWMFRWVSCVYFKYRTAFCMAEAMQESEDPFQIARENWAKMRKPERLPFQADLKLLEHRACTRQAGCQIQWPKLRFKTESRNIQIITSLVSKGSYDAMHVTKSLLYWKKSTVKKHVRSQKHVNGITNVKKDKAKSKSIEQCLYLNAVLPCY